MRHVCPENSPAFGEKVVQGPERAPLAGAPTPRRAVRVRHKRGTRLSGTPPAHAPRRRPRSCGVGGAPLRRSWGVAAPADGAARVRGYRSAVGCGRDCGPNSGRAPLLGPRSRRPVARAGPLLPWTATSPRLARAADAWPPWSTGASMRPNTRATRSPRHSGRTRRAPAPRARRPRQAHLPLAVPSACLTGRAAALERARHRPMRHPTAAGRAVRRSAPALGCRGVGGRLGGGGVYRVTSTRATRSPRHSGRKSRAAPRPERAPPTPGPPPPRRGPRRFADGAARGRWARRGRRALRARAPDDFSPNAGDFSSRGVLGDASSAGTPPPRRAVRRRHDTRAPERSATQTARPAAVRWRVGRWRPARARPRPVRHAEGAARGRWAWRGRRARAPALDEFSPNAGDFSSRGYWDASRRRCPGAQSVRGAREPVGQTSPSMAARCSPRHRAPRPRAEKWSLSGLNSARSRARSPTDGAGTPSPLAAPSAAAATPHERRSGAPPTPHDRGRHVARGPVASRSTAPATCDARGRRGEGEVGLPRAARALGQALDDFSPNAGEFSSH